MRTRRLVPATFAALIAFAACDDSATEPAIDDALINDDVAVLAADLVQEDLDLMDSVVPTGLPAAMAPGTSNSVLELQRSRTVTFYDAEGLEQEAYDADLTASINFVVVLEGDLSREGFEWSLDRSRDMTVSGLLGDEETRIWNGSGSEDRSRARVLADDGLRTYQFSGSFQVEEVVRPVNVPAPRWPLSGTITRNVEINVEGPNGSRSVTREVVVTFDGDATAIMTVNGTAYEVDLRRRGRNRVSRSQGT